MKASGSARMEASSSAIPAAPRVLSAAQPRSSASTYPGNIPRSGLNSSISRLPPPALLLPLISLDALLYLLLRLLRAPPPFHLHPLARLQVLVVREEVADLGEHRFRQ